MLTMRRLAKDDGMRAMLAAAARQWWQEHIALEHAIRAWEMLLDEARELPAPERPPDWPRHLTVDGTEAARETLQEFGVTVDLLDAR